MSKSICGANCAECLSREECPGCAETNGCPFGKQCYIAKYISIGGMENYTAFKRGLIDEINTIAPAGMGKVSELYPLVGSFVNIEYPLPGGGVKLLADDEMYLGAQVENTFCEDKDICFGVIARESFIIICEYGKNCENPELVLYKRR